jgi:hypothetical protein
MPSVALVFVLLLLQTCLPAADKTICEKDRELLESRGVFVEDVGEDRFLAVMNMDPLIEANKENNVWYLVEPYGSGNEKIGADLAGMYQISELKASPDKRYLAVLSTGEGHPFLEVVDLALLLSTHKYKRIHEIDPYPGSVWIKNWKGDKLVVGSDMLLNYRGGEENRVPDCLRGAFEQEQEFSLSMDSGKLIPLSADAREPDKCFVKKLFDQSEFGQYIRRDAACALKILKAYSALSDLKKALETEKDAEARAEMEKAIKELGAGKPGK